MLRGGHLDTLVAGPIDLEIDQVLLFQLNFLVIHPPGQEHAAIGGQSLLTSCRE